MNPKNKKPLVSIGVPIYNEEKYLQYALKSLVYQEYKNVEIIIADNASTDGTWDIVQAFKCKDSRIWAKRHKVNRGAFYNWKYVLKKAKGKYFMWAGGHDKWAPEMIEKCVTLLSLNESAVLASPKTFCIDMEGNVFKEEDERIDTRGEKTPAGRALSMCKKMIRCNALFGVYVTEELRKALPLPKIIGPDFVLLMRIAALGDIISCSDAFWYRRKNRTEERNWDTYKRQIGDLKIIGVAARYPLLGNRLYTIRELCVFKGTIKDRIKLLFYSFWKLFLNPHQWKLLLHDLVGIHWVCTKGAKSS